MRFLIINGPNLNLLGKREPEIYGTQSYSQLITQIRAFSRKNGMRCQFFQSNHEGALVDRIQHAAGRYDGIVINAAAYTHTSIAIADALRAVRLPYVEVHLSDLSAREEYRQVSFLKAGALTVIDGQGFTGYLQALLCLREHLSS
mgnify:CR=1 FL=1